MVRGRWMLAVTRLLPFWLVVFHAPTAAALQPVLHFGSRMCDGGSLKMECPGGYMLQLLTAHYGRTDLAVCHDAAANSTDCRGPDIADRLRPQCNGKNECHVIVGPQLQTTDACPGTSKYLHVSFNCAPRVYQKLACQDEQLSLVCPDGDVMRVIEATFGRTTDSVCPQEGAQAAPNCNEPTALQTTARMCNNEHKCDIKVKTSAFGEPCPGVHKYLNVSFKCGECFNKDAKCDTWASIGECDGKNAAWMDANCRKACWKCENDPTIHNITCEGKNAKLSCASSDGRNMSLRIMSVFYGRSDNSICPHSALHSNSCGETTAPFKRAHRLCTGRSKCKVDVYSQTMGGDPCPDTYKYMQLDYRCQACENALGNDTQCGWLAKQGECLHNPQYMYRDCFLTCSQCQVPACGNIHKSCEYYAMTGECENHKDWMLINCRESCRKCPSGSETVTTTTVSPATTTPPGGGSDDLKIASACEGNIMKITCTKGKAISIKSAFYGRQGNETCPRNTVDASTHCSDTNALSKLRQMCNAYSSCWLSVLISKLGDPCPEIYKYANVTYKCIDRSEVRCDIDCGSHGSCIGDNTCACSKGYKGEACSQYSCSEVNGCSGQGTCSGPNKCRCDEGWLGDTCNVPSCSGVNHCSQRGRCIGVNKCFCYPFFSGATCSECETSFPSGGKSCLPCPNCQHGTCVQKTEPGSEHHSYVGCFKDKMDDRDLKHLAWDSEPALSTVKCVLKCYLIGYKFAGLQDGNRCYCGNDYGRHGETNTCNTKCSGKVDGDVCGGTMATSVWRVTAGYCECDGPNWTGTRCDRCSVGYSGTLCISDSVTTTTTTAPTTKPTAAEVDITTTMPPETTTTTTSAVTVTTSTVTTTSSVSMTTKKPVEVIQTTSTTTKAADIMTTKQSTLAPPSTSTVRSTSTTGVRLTSITSSPDVNNSTTGTEVPKIGLSTMKRSVSLTMTLQMPWKAVYSNRQDPETKEFEANVTHTLVEVYNSHLQPDREVLEVVIKDIRKGSVVVEHDVTLVEPFAGSEEEDVLCLINDALQETNTVVGGAASLSQQTERMCAKRASFCENGGTLYTYENGTWYCICTPGSTGERCENSKRDVIITIVVIVIVCTVPLLLILCLCFVIEMRAAKQRKEKAAFVGTSVSYRYQDLSRAQKSSPRRLFQGQSMTENADLDGFEPRQI